MPIEIKEMHIKINVNEGEKAAGGDAQSADSTIQICLEEVAKMIDTKKER